MLVSVLLSNLPELDSVFRKTPLSESVHRQIPEHGGTGKVRQENDGQRTAGQNQHREDVLDRCTGPRGKDQEQMRQGHRCRRYFLRESRQRVQTHSKTATNQQGSVGIFDRQ